MARVKTQRYADHVTEWEALAVSAAANAAEAPQFELPRVALEKVLGDVRGLTVQQATLQASKQQVSQRLRTLMGEGTKLATLMKVLVKQHYGNRSEKLVEFRLQPFRGRSQKEEPAPPEGPADPSTP